MTAAERFLVKVRKTESCWLWTGPVFGGYGQFQPCVTGMNRSCFAHRFSYELFIGPIPEGLVLDHLCRVRLCVNPVHLEPVTQSENMLRAQPLTWNYYATREQCKNGHVYTEENTLIDKTYGYRRCRTCNRDRARIRREKVAA